MVRSLGVVATVILLAGCATPPKPTQFTNSTTVSKSKDRVWDDLLAYFTTNNIQIKTIETDSGVIYAERASFDPALADCGNGGLAIDVSRAATMNVFVRPAVGSTQVTVNTDFKVTRQFDAAISVAQCLSKGVLEQEILAAVRR